MGKTVVFFRCRSCQPRIPTRCAAHLTHSKRSTSTRTFPTTGNKQKKGNFLSVLPLALCIVSDTHILDVIEDEVGPDIMIHAVEIFIKGSPTKQIITLHQNLTYWSLGAIDGLLTSLLSLPPATPDSDCMDFAIGSHGNKILPHVGAFDEDNLLSRGQEVKVDVTEEDYAVQTHSEGGHGNFKPSLNPQKTSPLKHLHCIKKSEKLGPGS